MFFSNINFYDRIFLKQFLFYDTQSFIFAIDWWMTILLKIVIVTESLNQSFRSSIHMQLFRHLENVVFWFYCIYSATIRAAGKFRRLFCM